MCLFPPVNPVEPDCNRGPESLHLPKATQTSRQTMVRKNLALSATFLLWIWLCACSAERRCNAGTGAGENTPHSCQLSQTTGLHSHHIWSITVKAPLSFWQWPNFNLPVHNSFFGFIETHTSEALNVKKMGRWLYPARCGPELRRITSSVIHETRLITMSSHTSEPRLILQNIKAKRVKFLSFKF